MYPPGFQIPTCQTEAPRPKVTAFMGWCGRVRYPARCGRRLDHPEAARAPRRRTAAAPVLLRGARGRWPSAASGAPGLRRAHRGGPRGAVDRYLLSAALQPVVEVLAIDPFSPVGQQPTVLSVISQGRLPCSRVRVRTWQPTRAKLIFFNGPMRDGDCCESPCSRDRLRVPHARCHDPRRPGTQRRRCSSCDPTRDRSEDLQW